MSESYPIPDSSFEAQFKRIFEVAECKKQIKLADFLGIRQSSVSDAKRRQSIVSDWLITLYEKKQINPNWILTGLDPKRIHTPDSEEAKAAAVINAIEHRPTQECTTDELVAELMRRALRNH